MRWLFILLFILLFSLDATAAILVVSPSGGLPIVKTTLNHACTDADTVGKTIVITSPITITTETVPITRKLKIEQGGLITVSSGMLTINGAFEAGQYQTFSGSSVVSFGSATPVINPTWWYDGGATWTTAINRAIQSTLALQEVKLPAGSLPLTGNGTELILLDRCIKFTGTGKNSTSLVLTDGSVGASTATIRVSPVMDAEHGSGLNLYIADFKITTSNGSPYGSYGIYLDTTTSSAQILAEMIIERIWVDQLGGPGIYQAGHPASTTGNPFNSVIRNNNIFGGITLTQLGDTNRIENNFLRGTGYGLDLTTVNLINGAATGASANSITGNVSVASGGSIIRSEAMGNIIIDRNQWEGQIANTGADNALLAIKGTSANPMNAPVITNNKFGFFTAVGTSSTYLLIDYAIGAKVSGNMMVLGYPATQCLIKTTANAKGTNMSDNFMVDSTYGPTYRLWRDILNGVAPYTGISIQDAGIGTVGLPKPVTLLNSWTAYVVEPKMEKISQEWVSLSGMMNGGTKVDGTVLFALPVGYRPDANISIYSVALTSGAYVNYELRFDATTGNVAVYGLSTSTAPVISLVGLSFKTATVL